MTTVRYWRTQVVSIQSMIWRAPKLVCDKTKLGDLFEFVSMDDATTFGFGALPAAVLDLASPGSAS